MKPQQKFHGIFSGPPENRAKMPDFSRQKSAKKCAFFVIFRKKWCTPPNGVCTKIAKKMGVTTPDMTARKTCLQGRLSPGKKPANLYSTKCRFFAASPLPWVTVHRVHSQRREHPPAIGPHRGRVSYASPKKKFFNFFFFQNIFYNLKKYFKNFRKKIFSRFLIREILIFHIYSILLKKIEYFIILWFLLNFINSINIKYFY